MAHTLATAPRIEDYALIGDMRTCALVGKNGSIDFLCWPKFDSPSLFCRLLDTTKGGGGHWSIRPRHEAHTLVSKQNYRASSNILQTKFIHETGVVDVTDFWALSENNAALRQQWSGSTLIRKVDCVRGNMAVDVELSARPGYALGGDRIFEASDVSWKFDSYHQRLFWATPSVSASEEPEISRPEFFVAFRSLNELDQKPTMFRRSSPGDPDGPVTASFDLREGQQVYMIMSHSCFGSHLTETVVLNLERDTYNFWTDWIRSCTYRGRFQQEVERSMLILKLLTYDPTGAIVAAPTFSLPEAIGGPRNWDYRYSWVRDSSFTVYVFLKMGFAAEAEAYIDFIFDRVAEWQQACHAGQRQGTDDGHPDDHEQEVMHLPLMFSIDGHTEIPEKELFHLGGYLDSSPVRIGNAATTHVQLDIYGELLDAIYLYNKHGKPISYCQWLTIRSLIDFILTVVHTPDNSIWEVRGRKQHFTYSKIMLWVATDRGIRLADKRNFPAPNRMQWLKTRDELCEEIMTKGFNPELNSFIQSYESPNVLDSAVLIAPLVFFISPSDPQFLSTLEAILNPPERGGLTSAGFVFRYDTTKTDDGVIGGGKEGTFTMCTLWLVEALVRAGRYERKYLEKATGMFEQVTQFRNHVGMLSEEVALSGEQLGNTPQAFSHLAYVSAAMNLERVTREMR